MINRKIEKNPPFIYPSVSFVIPAYNCADVVCESIKSILNGNYDSGDEIIIVNDGSTDKTLQVLHKIQRRHTFIQVINNKENIGCPASRNIGICASKNSVIFNLDSDDLIIPGSKKFLLRHMMTEHADVVAFGESHFFSSSPKKVHHKWIYKSGVMTLADFLAGSTIPGGNYIYSKDSWARVGGYWEYGKGLHEYWGFSLKQIAMGSKFFVVPNTYYFHRFGRKSLYIRESLEQFGLSLMATKMIEPFLDLIEDDDARYILSEEGRKTWFDKINKRPIKVKNSPYGVTGRREMVPKSFSLSDCLLGILRQSAIAPLLRYMKSIVTKRRNR